MKTLLALLLLHTTPAAACGPVVGKWQLNFASGTCVVSFLKDRSVVVPNRQANCPLDHGSVGLGLIASPVGKCQFTAKFQSGAKIVTLNGGYTMSIMVGDADGFPFTAYLQGR